MLTEAFFDLRSNAKEVAKVSFIRPFESRLSTGSFKSKNPLAGVFVFCLIVELRGVEPRSKQETHTFSTCLVFLWLSGTGWRKTTNPILSSLILPVSRNLLQAIPVLMVLRMPLPTGSKQWRNIPSRCLAPGLS